MVRHYASEQEAYETRHALWEQRLQRERGTDVPADDVPIVDRYMFDLQGFFVVRVSRRPLLQRQLRLFSPCSALPSASADGARCWQGAIGAKDLAEMNAVIDAADVDSGARLGLTSEEARIMMADPHSPVGKEAQQGFGNSPCAGIGSHPVFDRLIGHPGFTPHVRAFVNGEATAMTGGGGVMHRWPGQVRGYFLVFVQLFEKYGTLIERYTALIEKVSPCKASGIHHGGPRRWPMRNSTRNGQPTQSDRHLFNWDEATGTFLCHSVNVMIALNDCPEHGGGTAIVVRTHVIFLCAPAFAPSSAVMPLHVRATIQS
eukprot:SAG31_NODE_174_length_21353_cov_23.387974_10_plen_316_part_00